MLLFYFDGSIFERFHASVICKSARELRHMVEIEIEFLSVLCPSSWLLKLQGVEIYFVIESCYQKSIRST